MLAKTDPVINDLIKQEENRQRHNIELIASENIVSVLFKRHRAVC